MPFPKNVGDSFLVKVSRCSPVETDHGPAVEFIGETPEDVLRWPKAGVDDALRKMGYVYDDSDIIAYDQVADETLVFSKRPPVRQGERAMCSIEKPARPTMVGSKSTAASHAVSVPANAIATEKPILKEMSAPGLRPSVPSRPSEDEKREQIRQAYIRELTFVLDEPLKLTRKKKADLDVNAAVATLLIQMDRKGCL